MQTSSNFFNKNLFGLEDDLPKNKKSDKYQSNHIVPDPLRLKEDLTPWTEINPKYNFNTERLIRFKQKINQQPKNQIVQQQAKQVKSEMISNLFNFYKNNKQKKRSTLNNAKRKNKLAYPLQDQSNQQNGWTLPPINDSNELQEDLIDNQGQQKVQQQKQQKQKIDKKKKSNFIQSISIREYLSKLKQKEKVFALSSFLEKSSNKDSLRTIDTEQFISNRYTKKKSKGNISNSLSLSKQLGQAEINYRYGPMKNPENSFNKKRKPGYSPMESLEQSFQNYKKAAEIEIRHQNNSQRRMEKNSNTLGVNFSFVEKNLFKSNVPLSSLFSSVDLDKRRMNYKQSPLKKYNTISYQKSFTPTGDKLILPKVAKNYSYQN